MSLGCYETAPYPCWDVALFLPFAEDVGRKGQEHRVAAGTGQLWPGGNHGPALHRSAER